MKFNSSDNPVKSFVIIGPPEKPSLDVLLEHAPELVILIEPEPEKARQLVKEFTDHINVHIVEGAIGGKREKATLVEYNFPGLRSLRQPTAMLKELFPGLSARKTISIDTQPFERIVAPLPTIESPTALYIDMPGTELDILKSIEDAGLFAQIHQFTIRCNAEPMFENGPSAHDIVQWMQERFFAIERRDATDPDWPVLYLVSDQKMRENQQLRDAAAEAQTKLSSLEAELANAQSQVQTLEQSAGEQSWQTQEIERLEAELSREREALSASLEERAKRSKALEEAQERAARIPTLEASLAAATREAETAVQKASETEEALAKCEDALKAKSSELQAFKAAAHANEARLQASLAATEQAVELANQKVSEKETALGKVSTDLSSVSSDLAVTKEALRSNEEQLRSAPSRINDLEVVTNNQAERIASLEEAARRRTKELERVQEKVALASQREQALEKKVSDAQEELKEAQAALNAKGTSESQTTSSQPESVKQFEEILERKLGALVPSQPSAAEARHSSPGLKIEDTAAQVRQDQDKELVAARAKIESLQSDLAIALRLQQQAQNDMVELRTRYRENEQVRATQSALLQKLTPRLQQAAHQLQQLSLTDDLPAALAIEVADPPSKPRSTRSRKSSTKPTAKAKAKTSTRKRASTSKKSAGDS